MPNPVHPPEFDDQRTLYPDEVEEEVTPTRRSPMERLVPFELPETDRYEPRGVLAVGGMGVIDRVYDRRLGRLVVRKRSREGSRTVEQRLAREAWVIAQLDHPNIIEVLDAGVLPSGRSFYVMPFIDGQPLSDCLSAAKSADARRKYIRTLRDTCEAIGYAHQEGFVHRDLKPDNIMVGSFGETRVMDWGLARPVAGPNGNRWRKHFPGEQVDLTRVGAVLGTPAYMSPEQAQGDVISPSADVWSLGAILYEIVLGKPLFEGENVRTILSSVVLGAAPKLTVSRGELPGPLHAILVRALADDPEQRFPDAKAMADELTRWLEGRSVQSHQYTPAERIGTFVVRWRTALGAVVLSSALGIIGVSRFAIEAREESAAAQSAMQEAIEERERGERYLKQSLLAQTTAAISRGDRITGEVLAAESLKLSVDPVSVGALISWAGQPVPERIQHTTALDVGLQDRLSSNGRWMLKTIDDALELWQTEPINQVWRQPFGHGISNHVADDGTVLVRLPSRTIQIGRDGAAIELESGHSGRLVQNSATGDVFEYQPELRKLPPLGSEVTDLTDCAYTVTFEPNGWWTACPGVLVHQSGDRQQRFDFVPELGDDVPSTMVATTDALFIGTIHSQVARLEPETTRPVWIRKFERLEVMRVRHNADGAHLIVLFADGSAAILDAQTGRTILLLPRSMEIQDIGVDGNRVMTVLGSSSVSQYRLDPSLRSRTTEMPSGVTDLAFTPDGRSLVLGSGMTVLQMSWPEMKLRETHRTSSVIKSIDFSSNGSLLVATSQAGPDSASAVKRYDAPGTWTEYGAPGPSHVRRLAMLGDGMVVANWAAQGPNYFAGRATDPLWAIKDRATNASTVTSNLDATVAVWSVSNSLQVLHLGNGKPDTIANIPDAYDLALSDDGTLCLVETAQSTMLVALDSGKVVWSHPRSGTQSASAAIDPTGSFTATGLRDGSVVIRALDTGKVLAIMRAHTEKVDSLAFSRDGATLITGGWDNVIHQWTLAPLRQSPEQMIEAVAARWKLDPGTVLRDLQ